jgi:hypothetical protein
MGHVGLVSVAVAEDSCETSCVAISVDISLLNVGSMLEVLRIFTSTLSTVVWGKLRGSGYTSPLDVGEKQTIGGSI